MKETNKIWVTVIIIALTMTAVMFIALVEPPKNDVDDEINFEHKSIVIDNQADSQTKTVDVEIMRTETGEVIHSDTHTVEAGETVTIYNTIESEITDIERVTVEAFYNDETASTSFDTNDCYGAPVIEVTEDDIWAATVIC